MSIKFTLSGRKNKGNKTLADLILKQYDEIRQKSRISNNSIINVISSANNLDREKVANILYSRIEKPGC